MGTLFRLPVLIAQDLPALIPALCARGRVYAAALDAGAHRLGEFAFGKEDTVIVGNEGHGISPEVLAACPDRVFIPMAKGVESLNAGVAASVLLWEMRRA